IHSIWSPTVHRTWKCSYFSKYKLLNTFSYLLSVLSKALVKACRMSFLSALGGCRTPDLCLASADWPCADHMHSPEKKHLSSNTHQTACAECHHTCLIRR
ncbi:unnamed protein product, partial [Staurois parvus]